MSENKEHWYNFDRLLSYNALYNFVISPRGNGKTYGALKDAIKDFLKRGNQFAYVRRYKEEFKDKDKFFNAVKKEFPKHKFEVQGYNLFIDKKVCGYLIPLSTSQKLKSVPYPNVKRIIFDEFIIGGGYLRYLKDEVMVFLDLYETIARERPNVKVLFLANNVSIVNPYFSFWDLKINPEKRFNRCKNGLIVVELFTDEKFIENKYRSQFGQLIKGTKYAKYSIENKSLIDDTSFIMNKIPKGSRCCCSFLYNRHEIAVYWNENLNIVHFNKSVDPYNIYKYAITKEEHKPNYLLLSNLGSNTEIKFIKNAFAQGICYYKDMEVKSIMYRIFSLLGVK